MAAEAFVKQHGGEGLKSGIPHNPEACPLANALGGRFDGEWWWVRVDDDDDDYPNPDLMVRLPSAVQEFIERFDGGEYPDLIERDS